MNAGMLPEKYKGKSKSGKTDLSGITNNIWSLFLPKLNNLEISKLQNVTKLKWNFERNFISHIRQGQEALWHHCSNIHCVAFFLSSTFIYCKYYGCIYLDHKAHIPGSATVQTPLRSESARTPSLCWSAW